jgi:hypothetical protein
MFKAGEQKIFLNTGLTPLEATELSVALQLKEIKARSETGEEQGKAVLAFLTIMSRT